MVRVDWKAMTPMKNSRVFLKSFMARLSLATVSAPTIRLTTSSALVSRGDQLGHLLPAAHDHQPVGHLEHVVHLVADDDDADAVGLQAA